MSTYTNFDLPPVTPPAEEKPKRSFFWPGFALGLLLTAAVSCGGMATVFGLDRISLADIQGSESPWTPPEVTPAPQAVVADEAADPSDSIIEGTFQLGSTARNVTNSRVNIRSTAGHLGKPNEDVIAQMQPGDTVEVIGAPQQADSLTWWNIRYNTADGRTVDGWVAEATSSGVVILGP